MTQLDDLASRLLRLEQQLTAYQKLHAGELAELWRILDECKQTLVAALPPQGADGYPKGALAVSKELKGEKE